MKQLDAWFNYINPDDDSNAETHKQEQIPDDWSQEQINDYLDEFLTSFQDDILENGGDDLSVTWQFYIDGVRVW